MTKKSENYLVMLAVKTLEQPHDYVSLDFLETTTMRTKSTNSAVP